jgi:hypothetical protein
MNWEKILRTTAARLGVAALAAVLPIGLATAAVADPVSEPARLGAGVISGQVVGAPVGTDLTQWQIHFENVYCDTKEDKTDPVDDYGDSYLAADGSFSIPITTSDCYSLEIREDRPVLTSFFGNVGFTHFIPAGSGGAVFTVVTADQVVSGTVAGLDAGTTYQAVIEESWSTAAGGSESTTLWTAVNSDGSFSLQTHPGLQYAIRVYASGTGYLPVRFTGTTAAAVSLPLSALTGIQIEIPPKTQGIAGQVNGVADPSGYTVGLYSGDGDYWGGGDWYMVDSGSVTLGSDGRFSFTTYSGFKYVFYVKDEGGSDVEFWIGDSPTSIGTRGVVPEGADLANLQIHIQPTRTVTVSGLTQGGRFQVSAETTGCAEDPDNSAICHRAAAGSVTGSGILSSTLRAGQPYILRIYEQLGTYIWYGNISCILTQIEGELPSCKHSITAGTSDISLAMVSYPRRSLAVTVSGLVYPPWGDDYEFVLSAAAVSCDGGEDSSGHDAFAGLSGSTESLTLLADKCYNLRLWGYNGTGYEEEYLLTSVGEAAPASSQFIGADVTAITLLVGSGESSSSDTGSGSTSPSPSPETSDSPSPDSETPGGAASDGGATTPSPQATSSEPLPAPAAVANFKPVAKGTAKVGGKLSAPAVPAGWTAKYQWTKDGVAIAGATSASYKLVAKDSGHKIALTVSLSKAGYVTTVKSSAAVKVPKLAATASAKLKQATVKAKAQAVVNVTVKAKGLKPGGKVKVSYGKKSVTAVVKSGKAAVKLPKLKKGKYTLKVTYLGSTETKKATVKTTLKLKVK